MVAFSDAGDLEVEAICRPHFHYSEMQTIELSARDNEGHVVSRLSAARFAQGCFHPDDATDLVDAFDDYSASAYGLAVQVKRSRRWLAERYADAEPFACGFLGIAGIETEEAARGHRIGLELIRFLQRMHCGMAWYVGLRAFPQEQKHGSPPYRHMQRRLVGYYASDPGLGFREDAPRGSPGLMTAYWNAE